MYPRAEKVNNPIEDEQQTAETLPTPQSWNVLFFSFLLAKSHQVPMIQQHNLELDWYRNNSHTFENSRLQRN